VSAAARLRGLGTASVTATLAVSAHAAAGGGLPSGAAVAELIVLATAIGAVAFTTPARKSALLALLSTGQLLGHLLLDAAGHSHSMAMAPMGTPTTAMLAAHVTAVAIGALLITVGEHLCAAVSTVVRRAVSMPRQLPTVATALVEHVADQPMRSALLLAASMSHRGPPVSPAF
jgi:hypothetical protein